MTPSTAQTIAETFFLQWGVPGNSFLFLSGVASMTVLLNLATINTGKKTSSSALPCHKYPPLSPMHCAGREFKMEKEQEIERVLVGCQCDAVGGWLAQGENGTGKKGGGRGNCLCQKTVTRGGVGRSTKLSKTKASPSTSSNRSCAYFHTAVAAACLAATVSTASASMLSPTPPTGLPPSTLAVYTPEITQTMSRRSTMSIAMAK
ncbi:hypothetical protein F5878DRAFT_647521 [Lentinula raphanica]|uniref:Uncharacterized protein n=1 Tax=Lentinula raphanica TaxID=153919 RepID=A0AA38NVV1_9AGAR|nr:hypothetical protein F5878DRAFT_647521 [Lentinula raphanica]